jgi:hypothetical protein
MDSFSLKRACVRRWYVIVPLLLMTAWYSHHFYGKVQPVYSAQTMIGLTATSLRVNQTESGAEVPRNGLLDVGGGDLIANQVALGLRGPAAVDRVVAAGGVPWYVVSLLPATSEQVPIVVVEATADTPTLVTTTLEVLVAQSAATVRTLQQQAHVSEDQMVTPFVVLSPGTPRAAYPTRVRFTFQRFLAGVGVSILLTVFVDVLLTRRKLRAQQRKQALVEAAAGPNPTHPPNEVHGVNDAPLRS